MIRWKRSCRGFFVGYRFCRESACATGGTDVTCSDQLVDHKYKQCVKRGSVKPCTRDKKL